MDKQALRPYLVIPKLIKQPTWGGTYIVEAKKWQEREELKGIKIGQSYELYDKSNLSLLLTSEDPSFVGEVADSKLVEEQSSVSSALPLSRLIAESPADILGQRTVDTYGPSMHLLLKETQALGNSFQIHIPDGRNHPRWRTKPESWYYFEPGLITCGIKKSANWQEYQTAVTELDAKIQQVAIRVRDGTLVYGKAEEMIAVLVKQYNPWQYVNLVRVEKGTLLDLSPCGIHHSWEEDLATIPLGNVLYEIQLNVMDDVSTLRSFDKGKMAKDGSLRPLQIDDYFAFIDRSETANDPGTHMRQSTLITKTDQFLHERILETKYYCMDRVTLSAVGSEFSAPTETFRHVFVHAGAVDVVGGNISVRVTAGHSAFVPAGCKELSLRRALANSEILISYGGRSNV